jgi:hypothetical protein
LRDADHPTREGGRVGLASVGALLIEAHRRQQVPRLDTRGKLKEKGRVEATAFDDIRELRFEKV